MDLIYKSKQKGSVWSKHPTSSKYWKTELRYYSKEESTNQVLGGIAFWYTPLNNESFNTYSGNYGGIKANFTGLLIVVDSRPNLNRTTKESRVAVVFNEIPRNFRMNADWCSVQNTNDNIILYVEYFNQTLKVLHTNLEDEPKLCVQVENIEIPSECHFGVSAFGRGIIFGINSFKTYNFDANLEKVREPGTLVPGKSED